MIVRRGSALVLAAALAFGLAGCVGTPATKPSTTAPAFASDEEAYKAAEKVYREYITATNRVVYADPATFGPALALSTGTANAADRKIMSGYHADGVVKTGELRTTLLEPSATSSGRRHVELNACIDVSSVALTYPDGTSAVDADRNDVQTVRVTLESSRNDDRALLISLIGGREDGPKCP